MPSNASKFFRLSSRRSLLTFVLPIVCIAFSSGVSRPIQSQTLDYGPYAGFAIGKGIRGNDYSTPLASCIHGTHSALPASGTQLSVSIAYSSQDYSRAMHVDQEAKATFLGIGGGGDEMHLGLQDDRSNRAFDIIVEAYQEEASDTLDNISWDAAHASYDAGLHSPDPATKAAAQQLARTNCGDRYIETVFNMARLFLVIHVSNQKHSSLLQFSGKMNGSFGLSAVSASGSLGGDLNIKQANSSGALTMDVFSEGMGGISPAADFLHVAPSDGLADIAGKLAAAFANLQSQHPDPQPVKYRLAPLPDMNVSELSDQLIFEDLGKIKQRYEDTSFRIANVTSLRGSDQRRALYVQPDADNDLAKLSSDLAAYRGRAAIQHDLCKQANLKSICDMALTNLGDEPARPAAELPPIGAATSTGFQLAVDGRMVAANNMAVIMKETGMSLLDSVRKHIQSNATNVDILTVIESPYISQMALLNALTLQPFGATLDSEDFGYPAYWKDPSRDSTALIIVHTDAAHQCKIFKDVTNTHYLGPECLAPVGKAMTDIANASASFFATGPINQIDVALGATTTDCFGNFSAISLPLPSPPLHQNAAASPGTFAGFAPVFDYPIVMGFVDLQESKSGADITIKSALGVPTTVPFTELVIERTTETHTAAEWAAQVPIRISALPSAGLGGTSPNVCAQNIK